MALRWLRMRAPQCRRRSLCVVFSLALLCNRALAIGFDSDDYIVAGFFSGQVGVYDHDFSFKGYIDSNFPAVADVEFDPQGNVVAVSQNREVRVYNRAGELIPERSFTNPGLGIPLDLDIDSTGLYYLGAERSGLLVLSPDGVILRRIGNQQISGVTLVRGNSIWGGEIGPQGLIRAYNLDAPSIVTTVAAIPAAYMDFSPAYQSVLVTDVWFETVTELNLDGSVRRRFTAPGLVNPEGVTRGPNGDVVVLTAVNEIYRWSNSGVLLETVPITGTVGAGGIIWAGIPEPSTGLLVACSVAVIGAIMWIQSRVRSQRGRIEESLSESS